MRYSESFPVPMWVRCVICIIACASVPLLVIAACLGVVLNPYLVLAVVLFATRAASHAFRVQKHILNSLGVVFQLPAS